MVTDVGPLHVETQGADSATERQATLRKRVTPNTLIVLSAIVVLVAALIFVELRIRHLTIASLADLSLQGEVVEELSAKDFKGKLLTAGSKLSWQLSFKSGYKWVNIVLSAPVVLRSYFAQELIAAFVLFAIVFLAALLLSAYLVFGACKGFDACSCALEQSQSRQRRETRMCSNGFLLNGSSLPASV